MNKFTHILLNGGELTPDQISKEDAIQTLRELRMLVLFGLKKKETMNLGSIKFILNLPRFSAKEAIENYLPQTDFSVNDLSYLEVRTKIDSLLSELKEDSDKINFDTISQYQNLAYRNNAIVQQLLDLGGESRAYYEGQLVESKPLV